MLMFTSLRTLVQHISKRAVSHKYCVKMFVYNVGANKTEDLVCNSDFEDQFTSHGSDLESTRDLSEYSSLANQVWHNRKSKERAGVCQFTASKPGLNHDSLHISADSSFDYSQLMFTDQLFSIMLAESNHHYQQYIQREENFPMRCHFRKDYWLTNDLYYTPFFSKVMKCD